MTEQMPGNWPQYGTYNTDENMVDEMHLQSGREFETQRRVPLLSQINSSPEERFFDCATSRHSSPPSQVEDSGISSYLLLESGSSGASEMEGTDWRLQVPPRELLDCQPGSSREIKDILQGSIERIQARIIEADEKERKAVRPEGSLTEIRTAAVRSTLVVLQLV